MPKFRCQNKDCKDYGKEEFISHVKFIWNETTKKLEANEAICLLCSTVREVVTDKGKFNVWFKAEGSRNYNNKTIKKYDYDHEAAVATTAPLFKKGG